MLLEFRASNYKSFGDVLVFSMIPTPKQKGLDHSIFKEKAGTEVYKGLCSAVIYGANASGKTNVIGAMDTFKSVLLRGHLRNSSNRIPNLAAASLELIPNNLDKVGRPVGFSIRFITNGLLVDYSFSADLGRFLEIGYSRKVLSETLYINGQMIFTRKEKLEFGRLAGIESFLVNAFEQNAESAKELATSNLNDEELFLMNGFKTMISSKLTALIANWMEEKFIVIYRADSMRVTRKFTDQQQNAIYIQKTLNEAAVCFGITSNALGYVKESKDGEAKLCSLFDGNDGNGIAIPAEVFESYGTIRFVNMFPLIVQVLLNGGTLVVDEFDASIHPMALMNIINLFHNDEVNIHHAQLIFNTHNPIFLNSNLYRRDEINFVERNEASQYSTHYTLADFGTTGENGVRKTDDYMKKYFIDRYGAIKNIDFTPIFEELLSDRKEV